MPAVNGQGGNRLLTDDVIVKEALSLLKNNLVFAPLVFRDTEKRFAKVGDTINIRKPFRTKTAAGRTLVKQPIADQTTTLQINNHRHFGLDVSVRDRTLSIEQFSERYLKSGIVQLANEIDKSIATTMAQNFFFSSGTPGTAIDSADFLTAKAYMGKVGVPDDGMRRGVLDMLDMAAVSSDIAGKYNEQMVKESIQKGYMGMLGGFDIFESANVASHTVGTYGGTPLVNGAGQTGSTLVTDGWSSGATTLNVGDVFTIAGVYEINPQTYTSTGRLQRFTVTSEVSDTSGAISMSISPSINDGTLTTVDAEGNTVSLAAYQNVSAAPADNAAITMIGSSATAYRQNFLFHKEAVALAMVDLELPQSATVKARVRDDDSGLSLSMTGGYDVSNHSEITRIDAVWGVKAIYPELGHRLFSAAG